jgi:quercetin dioxygenase-like cupin family protein
MPGGVRTEIHLTAADTGGAFCLLVDRPPPDWSLPPHRHRTEAETIHVVEGTFEVEVEGVRSALHAGQTIHVQAGAVHAGANVGTETGHRVIVFSPAGVEEFFLRAGAAQAGIRFDPAVMLELASRYGWEFIPPQPPEPGLS